MLAENESPVSASAPAPALDPDDHRAIAARLDLLHFQEEAPGMVFWHPRGFILYRLLEDAARRHVIAAGYREVRTPQLLRKPIWELSGHWQHFHDGMYAIDDAAGVEAALKPVSCPGHLQLVKRGAPSWRDLPLRYAEMGLCHRDEDSGALHGLLRLRQFTQDDGHVFCSAEQAPAEIERFCRDLPAFYRGFGFDEVSCALATRPAHRFGSSAWWDHAEAVLGRAARAAGFDVGESPGGGAFYGPKLEFSLRDRRGRAWQCATIQFDSVMPGRFGAAYVDAAGARAELVMLHRALYGSIERFLGMLLEHHGAQLPAWLAPVQVAVLPVAGRDHGGWASEVAAALAGAGIRARVDADDSLARRIALAHHDGVAFVLVVGAREVADRSVAIRGGATLALAAAVAELGAACRAPI